MGNRRPSRRIYLTFTFFLLTCVVSTIKKEVTEITEDIMQINLDIETSTDLCRYLEPNKARIFFYHGGPYSYEGNAVNMGKLLYGVDFYKHLLYTDVSSWLTDNKILSKEECLMVPTGSVFPDNAYKCCSSGFIVPKELFQNEQPIDVHVTVKEEYPNGK